MHIRQIGIILFATLALALSACEQPSSTSDNPVADAANEMSEAAQQAATEAEAVIEESAEKVTEVVEETVAESVEETEGMVEEISDAAKIKLQDIAPAAAAAAKTDWKYKEGEDYRRMTASQGTSSAPDKIEVAEIFWYGCPHCYDFDPVLDQWKEQAPADVSFVRIPVIWNPTNQIHAKIMYTADALGILDEAHYEIFKAIHQGNNSLTNDAAIVKFFKGLGVEEDKFRTAFNDFGVSTSIKRAENLTRRYGVRSVPLLVINGKYATDAPGVKSFADMINVTEELIERERQGQ